VSHMPTMYRKDTIRAAGSILLLVATLPFFAYFVLPIVTATLLVFALLALGAVLLYRSITRRFEQERHQLLATQQQLTTTISNQSWIEAALRSSEARFRQLAEHIDEVFWMASPIFDQVLYVSPAYERVWGRSIADLYDCPHQLLDAVHADDRVRVQRWLSEPEQSPLGQEYRVVQPNGTTRWVWSRAFPIRNEQGEVYRVAGLAQDITERKLIALALEENATAVRRLYSIAAAQQLGFNARAEALLEMGCQRFGLPNGVLSCISDDQLRVLAARTADGSIAAGDVLPLANTYCSATIQQRQPLSIAHAGVAAWRNHPCYANLQLETYIGTPVVVNGAMYGTLCFMDSTPRITGFTANDEDILCLMAEWISGEIERRSAEDRLAQQHQLLEAELRRAADTQAALLPQTVPTLPGFEIAAECLPALEVGGDFYDWQEVGNGVLSLRLSDVMGKGMPAALLMTTVRATLRAVVRASPPSEAMRYVVAALDEDLLRADRFVTLFLAQLDTKTRQLRYVDAGHGHAFVRRADGRVEQLLPRSLPVGVLADAVYSEGTFTFEAGDALILYSDGLIDARPDLALDHETLARQLMGAQSALAMVDRCIALLGSVGVPPDDVTILVLRCCDTPI
jgi:PAS domain S-box-containing protein